MKPSGPDRSQGRGAPRGARALLAAALAAVSASAAPADIFKCTGPGGHVTYSDAPCAGASGVRLDLKEPVEDLGPRRPAVAPNAVNKPAPNTVNRPAAVTPVAPPLAVAPNAVSRSTATPLRVIPQSEVAPSAVGRQAAVAPNPVVPPAGVAPGALTVPAPADLVAPVDRAGGVYDLSYGDRQRIADLEQVAQNASAPSEARESATLEISSVRRGALTRMSYDDLRSKDDYWVDLASTDPDRRRTAATRLAELLARYP